MSNYRKTMTEALREMYSLDESVIDKVKEIDRKKSAKKIDGVPLYKMARKGKTVEREPRFIRINQLSLTKWNSPKGEFSMACSKGTYVRTVLHDLGQKLGCGAHLTALRRTKIDQFDIQNAKPLEEIETMPLGEFQSLLIPIHVAVPSHVL